MSNVMKFRVLEPVRHESHDPVLGFISEKFDEGVVSPKNEQQEAALRKLVELGVAEEVKSSSSSSSAPAAKKKGA